MFDMTIPHWLRYAQAPTNYLGPLCRTLADKARQDVLRSNTVRCCPTSPDFVKDLSEFTAHYPTSEEFFVG